MTKTKGETYATIDTVSLIPPRKGDKNAESIGETTSTLTTNKIPHRK